MRLAAFVSPASSCMAAPVSICEMESWMSAARRVRSVVLSSASALAERSRKSSRPRFSERRRSDWFQIRMAAIMNRRTAIATMNRAGVHQDGYERMETSSGRSTTSRIPLSWVSVERTAQFSVTSTHVPITCTRHPGLIFSAASGIEEKSTSKTCPAMASGSVLCSRCHPPKSAILPLSEMRRP